MHTHTHTHTHRHTHTDRTSIWQRSEGGWVGAQAHKTRLRPRAWMRVPQSEWTLMLLDAKQRPGSASLGCPPACLPANPVPSTKTHTKTTHLDQLDRPFWLLLLYRQAGWFWRGQAPECQAREACVEDAGGR
jgi:hypothetical protein